MRNSEILANVVALGVLVITSVVNLCIQLGTGVIYVFWKEHTLLMLIMLVLYAITCSTALATPTTKGYFEMKYRKKHKLAVKECEASKAEKVSVVEKLRGDLGRYWMMAHSCEPQFVIGRSATCTASGAFCLLAAMALGEVTLRSYFMPWKFEFCKGESEYKWSTSLVLLTQIVTVVVGTIGPAFRFFMAINFRCPKKAKKACRSQFKVESYWIQILVEWRECPFLLLFGGHRCKRFTHNLKVLFVEFCIRVQKGVVVMSKSIRLVSIFMMSWFLRCFSYCKNWKLLLKCNNNITNDESVSELQLASELNHLSQFVLHLQGEETLIDLILEDNHDMTCHWFSRGKRKQPKDLLLILEKSPSLERLRGIYEFDSDRVPSLHPEEPPNCWTLTIVTLTSVAISLPGINRHSIKQLIRSVNEGLTYVRVIENNLDDRGEFENLRKTAEILWLKVEVYHHWLDIDLRKMGLLYKSPEKVLEELAAIAKNKYLENKEKDMRVCLVESPSKWPIKVLASNTMYRISRTILSDYEARDYEGHERLFERLFIMIADIFRACFTNLPRAIASECHRSPMEEREESIRCMIRLLGTAEKILESFDNQTTPGLNPEKLACIDGWRSLSKEKELSSSVSDTATSPSDVYLSIG